MNSFEARNFSMGLILISACLFAGCRSDDKPTRFYKDIDLYTFRGKQEISDKDPQYPYIRIDSISPVEKKIGYFYDAGVSTTFTYKKDKLGWINLSEIDDAKYVIRKYEIISGNGTIVNVVYSKNSNPGDTSFLSVRDSLVLTSFRILKDSTETLYMFPVRRKMHRPLSIDPAAYPLAEAYRVSKHWYSLANGKLSVQDSSIRYDQDRRVEVDRRQGTRCFEMGDVPFIWYHYLYHRFKPCKGD